MTLRTPFANDAKTYGFEWLRYLAELATQEGVVGANDFDVTAAGAGGMRVDVGAGVAAIKGDSGVAALGLTQGNFLVVNDAAVANAVTLAASHATWVRIDQIILTVRDSTDLGSGADDFIIDKVTGVPTSGATLDNRSGAGALPSNSIRLADVLVPALSSSVTAGNIRDRRPWARGAFAYFKATTQVTDATGTRQTWAAAAMRMECSNNNPLRLNVQANGANSVAGAFASMGLKRDGADIDATTDIVSMQAYAAAGLSPLPIDYTHLPAPGSYVFAPSYRSGGGGTATFFASAGTPMIFTVAEELRPSMNNN